MEYRSIHLEEAKKKDVQTLFEELSTQAEGLKEEEVRKRLEVFGPNKIPEKKHYLIVQILRYFWGPIPVMIEAAAILSAVLGHWIDFYIILVLLFTNSFVRFYEEYQAGSAIKALKQYLSPKCTTKRDGVWKEVDSGQLVPGDIVMLKLGNIVPADGKLFAGEYISIDQSALTGESLPIEKKENDIVYSGSIVKQGEMEVLVTATGGETYFGKTVQLVEKAKPTSHFQKAILTIGNFLIIMSLCVSVLLVVVQVIRSASYLSTLEYILLLLIASIPVALPAILSVTMAIGALLLSKMKAIVSRLEAIEEMAGIDVLCSDKTGTLTKNQLSLGDPFPAHNTTPSDVIFYGALASEQENHDTIDSVIVKGVSDGEKLHHYEQKKFTPFDPVQKKTVAEVVGPDGDSFFVSKGATQVILSLCHLPSEEEERILEQNEVFGQKGYRTIAVAKSADAKEWDFLGLLPLFDPLRDDAVGTVKEARENGLEIKMLTGDNKAIAKEIGKKLGLSDTISVAEDLLEEGSQKPIEEIEKKIEQTTTFCQIFPEHKYRIVQSLQHRNHIVAMTGDGVNDAPALKQADVGIAVSGATDAAREASALILLAPGIVTIMRAIEEARKIFERMKSYAIYRITETIRIILFISLCIIVYDIYPITGIMIILLALLNDVPILAIAYDNTFLSKQPVRWKIREILYIASTLGFVGIITSFTVFYGAKIWLHFPIDQLQSLIFLKLSFAGHLTLFAARTKHAFYQKPYPALLLTSAIIGTQLLAMGIVGFGIFLTPVPWKYIFALYGYCFLWLFILDGCKRLMYKFLERE